MPSTGSVSYTRTAKTLHWLMALLIIFMLCLGWSFDFLPRGEMKFTLFQLHKSIGITILLLACLRILWRLTHRAPPLPATIKPWEKGAAHLGHFLLYAAMLVMPLSGWLMVSASGHNVPTILYGLVPWPNLPVPVDGKETIDQLSFKTHSLVAYIFAALIVGHIAAAWGHHLFRKDDILLRMAPKAFHPFLNRLRGRA